MPEMTVILPPIIKATARGSLDIVGFPTGEIQNIQPNIKCQVEVLVIHGQGVYRAVSAAVAVVNLVIRQMGIYYKTI